jgi:hypothetical protein
MYISNKNPIKMKNNPKLKGDLRTLLVYPLLLMKIENTGDIKLSLW